MLSCTHGNMSAFVFCLTFFETLTRHNNVGQTKSTQRVYTKDGASPFNGQFSDRLLIYSPAISSTETPQTIIFGSIWLYRKRGRVIALCARQNHLPY